MPAIVVSTTNVHKDEHKTLKEYLEENYWSYKYLTPDEIKGLLTMINYLISQRINDKASDLSYTDLLNLKNKLQDL